MNTYNFLKEIKLQNVCHQDLHRETLNYILFEEGNAIATNGYILVICPVSEISNLSGEDIEKLNGHLIHRTSYEKLIKLQTITEISENQIVAVEKKTGFVMNFPILKNGENENSIKFVNYKAVIDNIRKEEVTEEIAINATQLFTLVSSVNKTCPILKPNGSFAIKVRFADSSIHGMIMPIKI